LFFIGAPCIYHVEIGCSTSKGVYISSGYFKNRGALGSCELGRCLTHYKCAPPNTGYRAKFDHCWSNGMSVIGRKTGRLASHLSRSFKVIGTLTGRTSARDFLLTFPSNLWPLLYRVQDIARLWPKFANFSEPTFIYTPPLTVFPWKIYRTKNVQWWGCKAEENIWSCLDAIHWCDRRTDGRTPADG